MGTKGKCVYDGGRGQMHLMWLVKSKKDEDWIVSAFSQDL